MGSLCNCAFEEEIKKYFGEDILGAFRNTIFGMFLDFPQYNWIGQISKCLLILEIQQDNKNEIYVWVKGEILKFTMLEFVIITGLKCTDNIDDYINISSSKSALMSRYFPDNKGVITRSELITQHKKALISVENFHMVEDDRYNHFSWGKVTFEKLMSSWQQDFNIAKQLYSWVECHFEISDPTTYAATSISGKLKRTADEVQQCVGTIAEEFGDFSTIPPQKILIKAGFASPVSPDYPLKKRKTVMFEQDSQAVMDDDTSRRDHPVLYVSGLCSEMHKDAADKGEIGESEIQHHHHGEISVSLQSHQHKSVPSSSTQPEGTSKPSLDGDEIKNYINKCFADKMAELVSLISKIPSEVVKALKNDENKQSQEDKIDEQQQSQEDGFKKQESPHKEDMHDVNAAEKEAGREDDFENEDCSDLKALEDVNVTAKEDGNEVDLKKQKSINMTDVQDEVGGTVTDSIQAVVDTILFGLLTPSTTKTLDVGASNKMTESQWDVPDNQIPLDFLDAQVRELKASKAKAPAKRERKNSRVLRSPYISKYGSGSKDEGDSDKEEKLKYTFDGYTINQDLSNELMIDYSQWIAVGLLKTHSAKKETDNHDRVNALGLDYKQLNFVVAHPQSKN
ncbi:hypothetical protein P3L10_002654 [Capsicum annuum]|uniref:uncharacterized protein LOC107856877 n=1 Tax=Capsicum annuum TaxID=4072 RepID=UPI001FB18092|nr:uncharacterized protein LOC107856877 [Capsicum annuum]